MITGHVKMTYKRRDFVHRELSTDIFFYRGLTIIKLNRSNIIIFRFVTENLRALFYHSETVTSCLLHCEVFSFGIL